MELEKKWKFARWCCQTFCAELCVAAYCIALKEGLFLPNFPVPFFWVWAVALCGA
jgi:hypothetical protein